MEHSLLDGGPHENILLHLLLSLGHYVIQSVWLCCPKSDYLDFSQSVIFLPLCSSMLGNQTSTVPVGQRGIYPCQARHLSSQCPMKGYCVTTPTRLWSPPVGKPGVSMTNGFKPGSSTKHPPFSQKGNPSIARRDIWALGLGKTSDGRDALPHSLTTETGGSLSGMEWSRK